jgi:hypothetical protein
LKKKQGSILNKSENIQEITIIKKVKNISIKMKITNFMRGGTAMIHLVIAKIT